MKIIGLTGSIATGKSFVAELFRKYNINVFSSDAAVASLLKETKVIDKIKNIAELGVAVIEGHIDKHLLSNIVFKNTQALELLENILHPLVEEKREEFLEANKAKKAVLLEIPLLFEKKYQNLCDKVIATYCSEKTQIERALRRKNIDEARLKFIVQKQMNNLLKAKLADFMVYTDISYEYTQKQIEDILVKEKIK